MVEAGVDKWRTAKAGCTLQLEPWIDKESCASALCRICMYWRVIVIIQEDSVQQDLECTKQMHSKAKGRTRQMCFHYLRTLVRDIFIPSLLPYWIKTIPSQQVMAVLWCLFHPQHTHQSAPFTENRKKTKKWQSFWRTSSPNRISWKQVSGMEPPFSLPWRFMNRAVCTQHLTKLTLNQEKLNSLTCIFAG